MTWHIEPLAMTFDSPTTWRYEKPFLGVKPSVSRIQVPMEWGGGGGGCLLKRTDRPG